MDRDEARRLGREKLLGDRLKLALKATGIERVVNAVEQATGWKCGCSRRIEMLNRWSQSQPK